MSERIKCSDIPDEEVFAACRAFHRGETKIPPLDALAAKYPEKVVYAKMMKLADKGKLNYGVSIRCAWVEEETP